MILDAVLLALAEVISNDKISVAILPEMRIAQGEGIQIIDPISKFELWLTGNVDYVVVVYDGVLDHKGEFGFILYYKLLTVLPDRLLAPGASRDDTFKIAKGCLFLAEAKRQNLEPSLLSYIPEAFSQAIALLNSARYV